MKNNVYIILVTSILFLTSCLDDKTSLDYKDIVLPEGIVLTEVATQQKTPLVENKWAFYQVTAGSELQLDVEVDYKGDDELTYEWQFDGEVISTEKNLRYVCTKGGTLLLFVYRKAAGNATMYSMSVSIRTPFSFGIAVLGKSGGQTQLDFVEDFGSYKSVELSGTVNEQFWYRDWILHENIYPLYNEDSQLGDAPFKVISINPGSNFNKALQILDKSLAGTVALDRNTMVRQVSMDQEFVGVPDNIVPKDFVNIGATSLLLDESGKIYTRVNYDNRNPNTGRFSTEPLAYNEPDDVPDKGPEVIKADGIVGSGEIAFIWEKEKKRFLALTASTGDYQNIDYSEMHSLGRITNASSMSADYIPLDNFDKELIAFIPYSNSYYKNFYFIYKDEETGDCYSQTARMTFSPYYETHTLSHKAQSCKKLSAEAAQVIQECKGRMFVKVKNYMTDILYMATDKAIYSMQADGGTLTKIHEFTDAGNIKSFVITSVWNDSGNALNRYFNGRVLGVIFDNGDFKVIKLYDDPQKPNEVQVEYLVNKHFDEACAICTY